MKQSIFNGPDNDAFYLPMLIHEFLLSNGEGAEFVAKGIFILWNNKKMNLPWFQLWLWWRATQDSNF